ncbi:MAG: F0F1 ATP synthase subunit B [Clostridia bacterium]
MGNDAIIGLDIWYLTVAICNVLILYSILKKLLFEKVKNAIDTREREIQTNLKDADKARQEAFQLRAEYEHNIAQSKDKAAEIIMEATTTATRRSDIIMAEAIEESNAMKQKATVAIDLERKKVLSELRSDISDLVTMTASKVIEKELNADDHKKLIQDFVESV